MQLAGNLYVVCVWLLGAAAAGAGYQCKLAALPHCTPMPSTPQAALAAERERAARRGQSGAAAPEIQIREGVFRCKDTNH